MSFFGSLDPRRGGDLAKYYLILAGRSRSWQFHDVPASREFKTV